MVVKLCILIEVLIPYSLVYFMGYLNKQLIFYDFFFAQLKWSGRIYTIMAVSWLRESGLFRRQGGVHSWDFAVDVSPFTCV